MVGDSGVMGCATCHQQLAKFSWRLKVAIASHPKTPNPEVPLALFDGIRRWLGFLPGFMFLYLLFLLISPDVSWHHSALEKFLMDCFGWVSTGQFTQVLVGNDSIAWEEEQSRTVH